MRDRIPTQVLDNGAIRYAVYDEQGAFLRYEWIKPADEPTDEGTSLTKANFLQDATAALLGLQEDDPTVDDAFVQIAEDNGAIGTLRAALAPLDDRWLLCDGSFIKNADYPELAPMLPDRLTDLDGYPSMPLPQGGLAGSRLQKVYFIQGYYIILGNKGVYFTQSLSEPWQSCEIITHSGSAYSLTYGDNQWVMYSYYNDRVRVQTAPSLSGPWTTYTTVTTSGGSNFDANPFFDAVYKAPYYIAQTALTSAYDRVYYSSNPSSGFTLCSISHGNRVVDSIWVSDDYIIVNSEPLTSMSASANRLEYAASADAETWTTIDNVYCIGYYKGQYVNASPVSATNAYDAANGPWDIWLGATPGAKTTKLCTVDFKPMQATYSQNLNALFVQGRKSSSGSDAIIYLTENNEQGKIYTTSDVGLWVGNDNGFIISASATTVKYLSPVETWSILPSADIPVGELYVKALH